MIAVAFSGSCQSISLPACAQGQNYAREKAAYDACQKGNDFLSANQYQAALAAFNNAVQFDPTSYSGYAHRHLAAAYRGLRQYKSAIDELRTSARFDKSLQLDYDIAMISYEAGDVEAAVAGLEKYVQESKDEQTLRSARALLKEAGAYANMKAASRRIEKGKLKEARPYLSRAAAYDPSPYSDAIHGNLAYVLRNTGQPELAIEEGKKAVALNPKEATNYYTIGLAYQDIGDFDQAISWLRRYAQQESNATERQRAIDFAQELADDRSKQRPGATKKPDYMEEQRETDHLAVWPTTRMPLKVFIKPGTGVKGYRSQFDSYIISAFDTWCAICPKISYKLVDSGDDADIVVIWTTKPLTMEESGRVRMKAGLTYVSTTGGSIDSAKIRMRTLNAFNNDSPIEDGECASIAMHEVGHSLGLGHSPNVADIMYFGSSTKQVGLPTERDKRTLAALYKDLPVLALARKPVKPLVMQYLPPPAFLPPKPSDTSDLRPPVFLPPPLQRESQKLQPPIFMPPPLRKAVTGPEDSQPKKVAPKAETLPFFVPPPK